MTDADGQVVWTQEIGAIEAGEGSVTWDGSTTSGGTAEEGDYTFTIEAQDESGNEVVVETLIQGTVDGMSFESGSPTPYVDGIQIDLGDIIEVMSIDPSEEEQENS